MKKWIVILLILVLPFLVLLGGDLRLRRRIGNEVKALQTSKSRNTTRQYQLSQLDGLPEPVQRYFRSVLSDGQQYIRSVHLTHDGTFKTGLDREWIDIRGEQYFTADEPGFHWTGRTALFTARDMYIEGKGRLEVSLLSLATVADGSGEAYDRGELLRWLGECVWFPTALLPGENLSWETIDRDSARLHYHDENHRLSYLVRFNAAGEISEFETERVMDGYGEQTWIGRVEAYEETHGMRIPMRIEALWRLDGREYSYARFKVREIEYE